MTACLIIEDYTNKDKTEKAWHEVRMSAGHFLKFLISS